MGTLGHTKVGKVEKTSVEIQWVKIKIHIHTYTHTQTHILYTVSVKKTTMFSCNIYYKTQAILTKFGTQFSE